LAASQEFPLILWNPKVLCRVHNSPPTRPVSEPDVCSPRPPTSLLEGPFKYYSPIYICVFQVVSLVLVSPSKLCKRLSSRPKASDCRPNRFQDRGDMW